MTTTPHRRIGEGYALDLLSPVQYVATELEGATALSSSELASAYQHSNPGDLGRLERYHGLSRAEANLALIEQALAELKSQVEQGEDGKWRLTRSFDELRYPGNKRLTRSNVNPHAVLRDPFNPMSGEFATNIRRLTGKDGMTELRESMQSFGWIPEFPAIVDERGVVLVGHRRLAVAAELGIEPEKKMITCGSGDAADARRFRLAIASNIGSKPFTPEERARIAEYLYFDREWTQARIAEALSISQAQVHNDLSASDKSTARNRGGKGRPRKLTDAQIAEIIRLHFDVGMTAKDAEIAVLGPHGTKREGPSGPVLKVIDQERGRREERAAHEAEAASERDDGQESASEQPAQQSSPPVHACPECGHVHEAVA